jgi:hypothetical protein
VGVGWAPVSSGCLGAYNFRGGLQGEGKGMAISGVGRCRWSRGSFSGRLAGLAQSGRSGAQYYALTPTLKLCLCHFVIHTNTSVSIIIY